MLNMSMFVNNIIKIYGEDGEGWLKNLPAILRICAKRWNFKVTGICADLNHNYLVKVRLKSAEAIVKLIFDEEQFIKELRALQLFQGSYCIKLLDYAADQKALLLAKAHYSLSDLFPEQELDSIAIYANFIKEYQQQKIFVQNNKFPNFKNWFGSIKHNDVINILLVNKALDLVKNLDQRNIILLHGDLHHGNVMSYENNWVMIDPKGVMGTVEFEIAAFLINPSNIVKLNIADIINVRVNELSKILALDSLELLQWSFVRAILASCWCIEDNLNPQNFISIAEAINNLLTE